MTITFDIPTEDEARTLEAFASILNTTDVAGSPRPAEAVDISGACATWVTNQTYDYERRKNQQQFVPPPLELQPPQWAGEPIPG
jgi:hypothetical protein